MPNQLTATGLTVKTITEIVSDLTTALQAIYGADINVDSNSPDGQLLNIFAQTVADMLTLLEQVYNSFSVPNSDGVYLDQRVALNGLIRNPGSYTDITVAITTTQSVTLIGLDGATTPPSGVYTVADAGGNQFYLEASVTLSAGTADKSFRAANLGVVQTPTSTPLNQVTVVTGISVVETISQDTTGTPEESDAALKIRQAQSFWLGATGPADSVLAQLLQTPGVIDAFVPENTTSSTANGVPAHGIWPIVNGGTDTDVATAIYIKKAPGCAIKGSSSGTVTRPNGSTLTIPFDRADTEALYIEFGLVARSPGIAFDNTAIKAALAAALVYKLGQSPNIGDVVVAMLAIAPQGYITGVGVSTDGMSYLDVVTPSDFQHYFTVSPSNITIS